jgi:hypothetical protein
MINFIKLDFLIYKFDDLINEFSSGDFKPEVFKLQKLELRKSQL